MMWVPMGMVYTAGGVLLAARWISLSAHWSPDGAATNLT